MKFKTVFIFLGLLTTSGRSAENIRTYVINNKKMDFIQNESEHITVNSTCLRDRKNCLAIKKLKMASLENLRDQLEGGANPGAVVCKAKLSGKLIMAYDLRGNQTTFCFFEDGSIISNGSIHYHAIENDKKLPSNFNLNL